MKRQKLTVEKRTIVGKKVKKLRREGILPANIYGKQVKSEAVQVPYSEFEKIFKQVRETGLLDLELGSELRPVLIHNVQLDHLTQKPLHADFYQVNLKEKVKTMVPLVVVGEAKAVTDKIGLLIQPLSEIEVEALPEDLPENIEVNVEPLAAIDEQIMVSDLKLPKGVEVLTEPSQIIVKISQLVTKAAQEEAAQAQAAAEAAKAETAEAGAAPTAEGEKSTEQPTQEAPKTEAKEESKA